MPRLTRRSKGAATLVVVIVLFFVMALVAAYANRNLVVEQRIASAVLDAGLASEAAQFGLDHVLAVLNADAVDEQCRPVDAGGSSLRERLLSVDSAGRIQPRWSDPSRRPVACDRIATGDWSCQCPSQHAPNLVAPGTAKAWSVRVGVGPALASPGALTLVADGCAQPSGACGKGFDASDANSTHHVDAPRAARIGLLPALSQAPAAALTVRGDVNLGSGLRVVHGQLAAAVRSGGAISGDTAGLRGAAGAVEPAALTDPALAATTPDLLLRRTFGMDSTQLPRHAKLRRLACDGSCQPALMALNQRGAQFVRVEGDLNLTEPGSLGSPAQPLLLLVEGDFQLQAAVQMHGLLVVRGNAALQGPAASSVRGAVIVGGHLTGQAGAQVAWDARGIQRLQTQVGSFIKLSGGDWSPP